MFLLISNNGILLSTLPYPPYAVLNVTFIGVASYSILLGIYSSAIVASNDAELRKSIRKFAFHEGKLLDSISLAEVQKVLQDRAPFFCSCLKTIRLGKEGILFGVAVNPVTNRIYVTDIGSNSVHIIDGLTNDMIISVLVGKKPVGIALKKEEESLINYMAR